MSLLRKAGVLDDGIRVPRFLRDVGDVVRHVGRATLDVIYPPHCMACRAAVQGGHALCPACWGAMRFIERPYCERLGTPFAQDLGTGLVSPESFADPPAYARARAVACFDDGPARRLVHALKYADRPDYAKVLGRWMARAAENCLDDADVVIPIPLHSRRLWSRRFNQAALLAQVVGRASGKPVDLTTLIRAKATRSQVGMTRAARAANIQGAFRLSSAATGVRGRRVMLVDDVLTTGATVNAATRVLLRGGASAVDVVVFARVVTKA